MNRLVISLIGILGVLFFIIPSIIGGFLINDYSIISQFISESFASDTTYGWALRLFGYIPSGILLTAFFILGLKFFPKVKLVRIGFYGLAVFYGIGTIMVAVFPCDSGCNLKMIDPSMSQILHNLAGLLTYLFVPFSLFLVGIGLKGLKSFSTTSISILVLACLSSLFVLILFSNSLSEFKGLFQRVIEGSFGLAVLLLSISLRRSA